MITTAMRLIFAYPVLVLTGIAVAYITLSHAEPELDRLCESRVVANGLSHQAAKRACERI